MAKVISGAEAVAEAVKLCNPGVVAAYPITPQTHIVEGLAQMIANGDIGSELIRVESEQSSMAACIGAASMGVRTYTATASQGIALMHEMLFAASGMRLPIVMGVANRALNSPLNIWNDQQDSFASRDSGWVQLYVENAQEALDTHIQAYKIAEEIRVPVMVCLDGFVITHTYEPVDVPVKEEVLKFLPDLKPKDNLNPARPVTLGGVGMPDQYPMFRKQQQDAMVLAHDSIGKANIEYSSAIGRKYGDGLLELVNMKDAKHAIITIGSVAGTIRPLLEKHGIGMIRIRALRPFPAEEMARACRGLESAGVLEKDISIGANGALYDEVRSALYEAEKRPVVSNFIAGLGGKDITEKDIETIISRIKSKKRVKDWVY